MSHRNGFLLGSQRGSLHEVESSVTTKEKMEKAAWERSGAVDYAMFVLNLHLLSPLHASLRKRSLRVLDFDKLVKRNGDKQLQTTATARPLMFALL